jgi:hypothetical protein
MLQAALLASGTCTGAQGEPVELSFGAASATVQRGIAIGSGGIDAFAAASCAHADGWRASLGATALHSEPSQRRWDAQLFWRLGHARRLDDDWSVQLAYAGYAYPSSELLRRYGYGELGATLAYRDLLYVSVAGLRRTHADSGAGRHSVAYDLVLRQALPAALSASVGLGRQETRGSSPPYAYAYGHLGLATTWRSTEAQLIYIATDRAAKQRFGDAAANRWTASLGWSF